MFLFSCFIFMVMSKVELQKNVIDVSLLKHCILKMYWPRYSDWFFFFFSYSRGSTEHRMLPQNLPRVLLSFEMNSCKFEQDVCRLCWKTLKNLINTGWPSSDSKPIARYYSLVSVSVLVLNAADNSEQSFSFLYFWSIHLTFHQ